MEEVTIKELPSLLRAKIGPKKVIKRTVASRLIPKGENYGSEIIQLEIFIENIHGRQEILHGVAKTLPREEFYRKVFRVQITFTNEMAFYDYIVPALKDFQKEVGVLDVIDCFAECYGTRKNLKQDDDTIDDDAVLVLENLRNAGFRCIDRRVGFDLDTTKLILRDLATFHGIPLALRLKKPEVFEKVITPYCTAFLPPKFENQITFVKRIISENKEIAHLETRYKEWGASSLPPVNDMFGTIVHSDMWTNNTMQKFEDGKAVENKFVDFQAYDYGSAACDVVFFLWSSVKYEVLVTHFDSLLEYYYDHLVNVLAKHTIDTSSYTLKKFLEEVDSIADFEFSHAMGFFLFIVSGVKAPARENNYVLKDILDGISGQVMQKTYFMFKEADRRGWIK